jgi:cation transporter-like permease
MIIRYVEWTPGSFFVSMGLMLTFVLFVFSATVSDAAKEAGLDPDAVKTC